MNNMLANVTEETFINTSGNLRAGLLYARFENIGRENAIVNGLPLLPGEVREYPYLGKGYQAITFEAKGKAILRTMRIM